MCRPYTLLLGQDGVVMLVGQYVEIKNGLATFWKRIYWLVNRSKKEICGGLTPIFYLFSPSQWTPRILPMDVPCTDIQTISIFDNGGISQVITINLSNNINNQDLFATSQHVIRW